MNFLAHLYLSGNSNEIMIGNFIGDYVKGKQYEKYPEQIKRGILLHRNIDWFTDRHPLVKQSASRLKPKYRLYSGIVVDIFYDHFLSVLWNNYANQSLNEFIKKAYTVFSDNAAILPQRVQDFLPHMIRSNRLESYSTISGVHNALKIMSGYTSLPEETDFVTEILESYYNDYSQEFTSFFPEIQNFVTGVLDSY